MRQDDICCVLFGSKVPMIMREEKNFFRLIGECYVHGVMRGEANELLERAEAVPQTFNIQ